VATSILTCGNPVKLMILSTFFAFFVRLTGFSKIYHIIVIASSCFVFVLLIAVGLLTWRLRRAVNKSGQTPRRHTSDEVEQHDSTPDQHVPEDLSYMELKPGPLKELPRATQTYQSLQDAATSSAYYNAGFKHGNNNREDDVYYEIGNVQ